MEGDRGTDELLEVVAYSDEDFAADKEGRKSVTGGLLTMTVSWTFKKQGGVSLSRMEAEQAAASVMTTEILGVHELRGELSLKHEVPMMLRVDDQAALKQLEGEGASAKAKHTDVRIKFVGDYTKRRVLNPEYREGENMPTDLMAKRSRPQDWSPFGELSGCTEMYRLETRTTDNVLLFGAADEEVC